MTNIKESIDPSISVNEILQRHPAAVSVLNAHGIDTCCGGASALRDAAIEANADLDALLREIARASKEAGR
jgi:iron-sulfur cluster repair protein YtfE (RIC family)